VRSRATGARAVTVALSWSDPLSRVSTRNPDEHTEPGRALGGRGTVRGRGLGRWVQARLGEPGWLEGVAGAYGVGDAGVGEAGG
jgi:hypothetical protein